MVTTPHREPDDSIHERYLDLRQALVWGEISEAEAVTQRLGESLRQQGDVPPDRELSVLRSLIKGVERVRSGDLQEGITGLLEVSAAPLRNTTPQFVAWFWIARALAKLGRLEHLRTSIERMIGLSEPEDEAARALCSHALAELEVQSGRADAAFDHLDVALKLFHKLEDSRGEAAARLSEATLMAALGDHRESIFASKHALVLDPEWSAPLLFQIKQALLRNDHELLEGCVVELDKQPRPQLEEVILARLARGVLSNAVPGWVADDFTRLLDEPPAEEVLEQLEALMARCPELPELRLELAFKLLALGRYKAVREHLSALSDADPELVPVVQQGLRLVEEHLSPAQASASTAAAPPEPAPEETAPAETAPPVGVMGTPTPSRRLARITGEIEIRLIQQMDALAGGRRVFSGNLTILTFPDLLEFLHNGRRTGQLMIKSDEGVAMVCLKDGWVTSAAAPCCNNVGERLVERGVLTVDQLEAAVDAQDEARLEQMLGAILARRGVDEASIKGALTEQAQAAVQELFGWTSGEFAFSPQAELPEQPAGVALELDPRQLLLEAARLTDEANQ
jgi:tetratricopeptide (TPR) repeat protein